MQNNFVFPLIQHAGFAPCKPVAEIGQEVQRGQLIAVPTALGANIHSSVYGKVIAVTSTDITIEAYENQPEDYLKIPESNNYIDMIREAGVIGAGGGGFPTHTKLASKIPGGTVIANAVECEALINHNILGIETKTMVDYIIKGLQYVIEITNAATGLIAVKREQVKAIAILETACEAIPNIEVKAVPNTYPAGDERVVVKETLGKELTAHQMTAEINVIVCNVETLKNIVRAIEERRPVITKDVTIGGRIAGAIEPKVLFDTPVGTPIESLINQCGGILEPYGEIIIGGPFSGRKAGIDEPVIKKTGGIFVSAPFNNENKKVGIIACEGGGQEQRLRGIAEDMGMTIVTEKKCKRMVEAMGRFRCDNPGVCPGQEDTLLDLKNAGAEAVLLGACDQSFENVAKLAPKLGMSVYRSVDHILKATK